MAIGEITARCPDAQFDLFCARLRPGVPRFEVRGNVTIRRIGFGIPRIDRVLLALTGASRALKLHRKDPYDMVWAVLASYGGLAGANFKKRTGVPFLLTLQEGTDPKLIERKAFILGPYFKEIFRSADALQAISSPLLAWGKRMGFSGDARIVPNGVDAAAFGRNFAADEVSAVRQKWGLAPTDTAVITLSRFVEKNGVADLVSSLSWLPENVHLIACGEGPLASALADRATRLGVSKRVHFQGFISREEIPSFLKAADIFARPSLSEGLGNAFLEAMAARIPVVGTDVGGIADFLKDGTNGFVCRPGDPASVASSVSRILALDPAERERILSAAHGMVHERYTWDIVARQMREIFLSLCPKA